MKSRVASAGGSWLVLAFSKGLSYSESHPEARRAAARRTGTQERGIGGGSVVPRGPRVKATIVQASGVTESARTAARPWYIRRFGGGRFGSKGVHHRDHRTGRQLPRRAPAGKGLRGPRAGAAEQLVQHLE